MVQVTKTQADPTYNITGLSARQIAILHTALGQGLDHTYKRERYPREHAFITELRQFFRDIEVNVWLDTLG